MLRWISMLGGLSGGQRQLRDRGRAGHSGTHELGDGGRARHAHPLHRVAGTNPGVDCG